MIKRKRRYRTSPHAALAVTTTDEDLLRLYLSSSPEPRGARFITTAQAAVWAGVSRRTIQHWIESGHIRAVRIGSRYRVDRESLMAYLLRETEARD